MVKYYWTTCLACPEAGTDALLALSAYYLVLVEAIRIQALLDLKQGLFGEAQAALEEAVALARQIPFPYVLAKALSTHGNLLVACGQQAQARDQYAAALAILCPLGEQLYADRIQHALADMARQQRCDDTRGDG